MVSDDHFYQFRLSPCRMMSTNMKSHQTLTTCERKFTSCDRFFTSWEQKNTPKSAFILKSEAVRLWTLLISKILCSQNIARCSVWAAILSRPSALSNSILSRVVNLWPKNSMINCIHSTYKAMRAGFTIEEAFPAAAASSLAISIPKSVLGQLVKLTCETCETTCDRY